DVLAKPGRGHAPQLADHGLVTRRIAQIESEDLPPLVGLEDLVIPDVVVLEEKARDLALQLRGRHVDAAMLRPARIADPRQHVGYGICHAHVVVLSYPLWTFRNGTAHQLAFRTPGI